MHLGMVCNTGQLNLKVLEQAWTGMLRRTKEKPFRLRKDLGDERHAGLRLTPGGEGLYRIQGGVCFSGDARVVRQAGCAKVTRIIG